ncbi:MAG TPA: hypothetical protein VIF60_15770 [Burkholderiaceae bacterium]
MALIDYQTAVGRLIRGREEVCAKQTALADLNLSQEENAVIEALLAGPGLRFTRAVQRSWCKGRARNAAYLTLSMMAEPHRQTLLDEWVESGGGIASFFAGEAERFLEFIALRLPPRSHLLSVCRMEQAVQRVNAANDANAYSGGSASQVAISLASLPPDAGIGRAPTASLVEFFAEPNLVLQAVHANGTLPPVSAECSNVFFGPQLPGMFRQAQADEAQLWNRLYVPTRLALLRAESSFNVPLETMVAQGLLRATGV